MFWRPVWSWHFIIMLYRWQITSAAECQEKSSTFLKIIIIYRKVDCCSEIYEHKKQNTEKKKFIWSRIQMLSCSYNKCAFIKILIEKRTANVPMVRPQFEHSFVPELMWSKQPQSLTCSLSCGICWCKDVAKNTQVMFRCLQIIPR